MVCLCGCFPPQARVLTTRGKVTISDLKQTDHLLTAKRTSSGQISFKRTPFVSYLHFDPNLETVFLTLTCEDNIELVISEYHLLFKVVPDGKWKSLSANIVQVGDKLVHVNEQKQFSFPKVIKITKEVVKGVYAPLTLQGTLIVDNVLTSSYAHANSHEVAHASFAPLRLWYRLASRLWETSKLKDTQNNNHPTGINQYAKGLMAISEILPRKFTPGIQN